jgi:hypothetical protein
MAVSATLLFQSLRKILADTYLRPGVVFQLSDSATGAAFNRYQTTSNQKSNKLE